MPEPNTRVANFKAELFSQTRWVGLTEVLVGGALAHACLKGLATDGSSLGEVYYFWGFLGSVFCFVIPGLLLALAKVHWPQLLVLLYFFVVAFFYWPLLASYFGLLPVN